MKIRITCFSRARGIRTELREVDKVVTLEGLETTVGITSPDAPRCERVMELSELGHIITMGEFAIVLPNTLGNTLILLGGEHSLRGWEHYIAIHPTVFDPVLCRTSRGFVNIYVNLVGSIRCHLHSTVESLTVA